MSRVRETIKATSGLPLGFIDDEGNRIYARLTDYTPLGYYDKATGYTCNMDGTWICKGNVLSSLIWDKCPPQDRR